MPIEDAGWFYGNPQLQIEASAGLSREAQQAEAEVGQRCGSVRVSAAVQGNEGERIGREMSQRAAARVLG